MSTKRLKKDESNKRASVEKQFTSLDLNNLRGKEFERIKYGGQECSPLSLHISANENSNKVDDSAKAGEKKDDLDSANTVAQNLYEFPRQTNENTTKRGVMEFKASQKLFNPNEHTASFDGKNVCLNMTTLNRIFKSPPGTKNANWRQQILEAAGFPQYISTKKILSSVYTIQKEVATNVKRECTANFDKLQVVIGNEDDWEKLFGNEIVQHSKAKDSESDIQILRQKQNDLEDELKKERDSKAATVEENLKLTKMVKQREDRIGDLEYRLQYQQRRTVEVLDKLDKKEEYEIIILEKMRLKEEEAVEILGQLQLKEKENNLLKVENTAKDETIIKLEKENEETIKKLRKSRELNHKKAKRLNSKGVSAKSTTRKRVNENQTPVPIKKPKVDDLVMADGKSYLFGFMILCVQLSWLGIFDTKIGKAINLITSYLNMPISRIPDRRTIGKWCNEFSLLIDVQLDKIFETASNITLHSDETTLSGDKLQAYVISVVIDGIKKYFVVGIEHVPDKSAARSLKAFIACLKRSIKPFEEMDDDTVLHILTERLGKIKNVVSDRASTQKKFNFDLWKLIVSLIPGSPRLNEIFCHHHVMASSWDVFIKSCLQDERLKFDCPALNLSTLQTVIQFISSTYGERGNAPAKAKHWNNWCTKKGFKHFKFPSKLGSRWNVGFSICAALYYNRKKMLDFLKETNYIIDDSHAPLVKVLQYPAFISPLQIGAWIDQVINGPWWTEIDSNKHIIELNIGSAQIIQYLEEVVLNPYLFDNDEIFPLVTERSSKQVAYRDTVLESIGQGCLDIIPQFCEDLVEYLKKQLNSLLEDAVINDEANREVLASASVTNKVAEQVFGMATDMRHHSTSKSNGRIAANVAGVKNQTMEYIHNLSPTEFKELQDAFKAAKIRHRLQRFESKKLLKEEITESYVKVQEKQCKKKKKKKGGNEINYDMYIGQSFTEKWGEREIIYQGIVTKKDGNSYEIYYPEEHQYDIYSSNELKDLIATKKIVFSD